MYPVRQFSSLTKELPVVQVNESYLITTSIGCRKSLLKDHLLKCTNLDRRFILETLICPTCGCSLVRLGISKDKATIYTHAGRDYFFCCKGCVDVFVTDPKNRIEETKDLVICPTCLAEKNPQSAVSLEHDGKEIYFCRCPHCVDMFKKNPSYYLMRLQGMEM